MKERVIKYQGLDLKLSFDIDSIRREVAAEYKPQIQQMKQIIDKRDKYIKSMHKSMRDIDTTIFVLIDAVKIYRKAKKAYNIGEKSMHILSYMNGINMCTIEQINRYMSSVFMPETNTGEMRKLIGKDYVVKIPLPYYFAITDKGKKIIKNIYRAFRDDFDYFKKNKPVKVNHKIRTPTGGKYSPEELEKRSQQYRRLMFPFWDGGYKVIPKNRSTRCSYLAEWITNRRKAGLEVDDYYMKLLEKWSAVPESPLQKIS